MSFLPINEENKDSPQGQTTNAPDTETQVPPQTGGSVGDEGAGSASSGKGANTGSPTQFGSSASKLGDYLSANAPQIGQQADTLATNLNTQYGDLNKGITDAANNFQQSVKGGYAANNPDAVNQAVADPTKFASDPNNVAAFQGQYNNAYTGPANFEGTQGYSDLQGQVGQAVTQGGLLGTQAGLQSYLQGQGTNPTSAMSTLDSLLLRGNPDAQAKINTAAGQFGNLTGQLGTATIGADQSVLDAQKAATDSKAYAQGQFNPYIQNFGNQIAQGAQTAEQGRQAYNDAQLGNYNKYTPLSQYVNSYQGDAGYQFDNPFQKQLEAQPVTNPINAQNFSTPEQYQQASALQQLAGGTAQLPISADTANQAGTASQVPTINPGNVPDMIRQIMESNQAANPWKNLDPSGSDRPTTEQSGRQNTAYQTLLQNLSGYDPDNIKQTQPNIWNYIGKTNYNPTGIDPNTLSRR